MVGSMYETALKFEYPPVRAVELSFFFAAVPLKLTDLAPLVTTLRESFPHIEERFARVPWIYDSTPEVEPTFIEEGTSTFPFPWLTFSDESGHSVSFQDDRFILRWEFRDEHKYPGYESLAGALDRHFTNFRAFADQSTSTPLRVAQARAEYENSMPADVTWTVTHQAFRQPTRSNPVPLDGLQSTSAGGLFHFGSDEYTTHVEYSALGGRSNSTLSLRSTSVPLSQGVSSLDALNEAHSHLEGCFAKLTSQEQRTEWGQK